MSKRKRTRPNQQNPAIRWLISGGIFLAVAATILFFVTSQKPQTKPISQLTTEDFHALAFSPTEPETIFFGHHNGLLISHNGGKDWTSGMLANADAMSLALSTSNPQVMYAAGHDVFYKSDDAGKTWEAVKTNLPSMDIHGFAVDPNQAGHVFANVAGVGIFGSSDGGNTWTALSTAVPSSTFNLAIGETAQTLYAAATQAGLLHSIDGGKTWQKIENLPGAGSITVAYAPASKRLYATTLGSTAGLYISDDGGKTWVSAFSGTFLAIAISPLNPNHLVIVNEKGQVYASRDNGKTWNDK